jgi:hypothetical protein
MDAARCRRFFLDADRIIYHRQYEALQAIFDDDLENFRHHHYFYCIIHEYTNSIWLQRIC